MRRIFLLLLATLSFPVLADTTDPTYDRITLSESARAEVENDLQVAVMFVQREGRSAESLAAEVNEVVNQALERLRSVPGIKVQTQSYRTTAVYRKTEVRGWRVHQSIRLESRDPKLLSELIGELQSSLKVQSIGFQVSDERRREHTDSLIDQALARFSNRAKRISKQLGRAGYRIVRINVNQGHQAPVVMRHEMRMADAAPAGVPAPRIEAGSQHIEVVVTGEIELLAK